MRTEVGELEPVAADNRPLLAVGWLDREALLAPLVWARLMLCFAASHFVISSWPDRSFVWGRDSAATPEEISLHSVGLWTPVRELLDLLHHLPVTMLAVALVLVAISFALFGGRALALAFALLVWSMQLMNPLIMDGGDNALAIAVLLLPFTIQPPLLLLPDRNPIARRSFSPNIVTLHNTFVLVLVLQLAVIYVTAGLWKMSAPAWRSGDALGIVLRTQTYNYTQSDFLQSLADGFVGAVASWGTLAIQALAPLGILFRRIRGLWVGGVVAMHIGIMLVLGLVTFALIMIGLDCFVLALSTNWRADDTARRWTHFNRVRRWLGRHSNLTLTTPLGIPIGR